MGNPWQSLLRIIEFQMKLFILLYSHEEMKSCHVPSEIYYTFFLPTCMLPLRHLFPIGIPSKVIFNQ